MLVHFKNECEEEECPVPEDIRDELLEFHADLLAHCGEDPVPTPMAAVPAGGKPCPGRGVRWVPSGPGTDAGGVPWRQASRTRARRRKRRRTCRCTGV